MYLSCSSSSVLIDDQAAWIEETSKLVYQVCPDWIRFMIGAAVLHVAFYPLYLSKCPIVVCPASE